MRIGVFDSGLGGLIITHSLTRDLPEYDYLYLGDTAHVPYGNRSQSVIYDFTCSALDYLFAHDCELVIIACNTASAEALRRIQHTYLPKRHPGKTVLGVLIPAAEAAVASTSGGVIGVLATASTVSSGAFEREVLKLQPQAQVISVAAPLLVPLVEAGAIEGAEPMLRDYLAPLGHVDTLILGCTHYPYFKTAIAAIMGTSVRLVSQDDVVPPKLKHYLDSHPQLAAKLSRSGSRTFLLTDVTPQAGELAARLYGQPIRLEKVEL